MFLLQTTYHHLNRHLGNSGGKAHCFPKNDGLSTVLVNRVQERQEQRDRADHRDAPHGIE